MLTKRLLLMAVLITLLFSTTQLQPGLADDTTPQTGKQPVRVFDGPGIASIPGYTYNKIAILPAGTPVVPLAVYVDFTRIQFVDKTGATLVGYAVSKQLVNIPAGLPVLNVDQVPWQPAGTLARKVYEFNNTDKIDIQWHGFASVPYRPNVHIVFQVDPASQGNIQFSDRLAYPSGIWYKDRHIISIGLWNGVFNWGYYDGVNNGQFSGLGGISDGIIIVALQPDRRVVTILNKDGQPIVAFDSAAVGNYPKGFFPVNKPIFVELIVSSNSNFTLKKLGWQTPPSGRAR